MGEKQGKVEKKEGKGGEKKNKGDQNKKEEKKKDVDGVVSTVIMVLDMHCEGCALKIKRSVKIFEVGVDAVSTDVANNKLTVIGKVDPLKIRERVESKTRRKVDLISPVNAPKKGSDAKKPQSEPKEQKKPEDKKPKEPAASTVVLKIRLHCQGCIQKIRRTILRVKGVENVNIDSQKDSVTVKGAVDASNLATYLRDKLKRSVEIVPPKKDGGGGGEKKEKGGEKKGNEGEKKNKSEGGEQKKAATTATAVDLISPVNAPKKGSDAKKPQSDPKEHKKPEDKKPKEPVPSTVVLKIRLHCQGCIQKIRRTILRVKGVENVNIDSQKDSVTVKGAVDASNLATYLRDKLKRSVEIVPPKKDGGGGGGEKKEKGGEKKGNEGEKKNKSEGGEQKKAATSTATAVAVEANKMEYYVPLYGGYRIEMAHAPQLFSDENPNACSIM